MIGIIIWLIIGGIVNDLYGWRIALMLVGAPGLPIAQADAGCARGRGERELGDAVHGSGPRTLHDLHEHSAHVLGVNELDLVNHAQVLQQDGANQAVKIAAPRLFSRSSNWFSGRLSWPMRTSISPCGLCTR